MGCQTMPNWHGDGALQAWSTSVLTRVQWFLCTSEPPPSLFRRERMATLSADRKISSRNLSYEMWQSQSVTQKAIESLCPGMDFELLAAVWKNRWALGTPSKSNTMILFFSTYRRLQNRVWYKNKVSNKIKHLRVEIFKRAIWQLLLLCVLTM